ncbi:hypothetical protein AURDEDRAFT_173808 [Auricularia subglabra TFB-10046 SS5]|nr:hypothetical protein AURDEDRAFT_173808 [Auricularia subglabra TFB-10046 SS5]
MTDELPLARRYVMYPIDLPGIWALYKQLEEDVWSIEGITHDLSLSSEPLAEPTRALVIHLLAIACVLPTARISDELGRVRRETEAACFLGMQRSKSYVHIEALAVVLDERAVWGSDVSPNIPEISTAALRTWLLQSREHLTGRIAALMLCYHAVCETALASLGGSGRLNAVLRKLERDVRLFGLFAVSSHAFAVGRTVKDLIPQLSTEAMECTGKMEDIPLHVFNHLSEHQLAQSLNSLDDVNDRTSRDAVKDCAFTTTDAF